MRNKWSLTILAVGTASAVSFTVKADFYRWVDDQGQLHVTTEPPPNKAVAGKVEITRTATKKPDPSRPPSKKILHQAGVLTGPGSVYNPRTTAPSEKPLTHLQPAATPQIEIYVTSWCGWCKKTKEYFRSRGVAFTEYDIETDAAAKERHKALNPGGGVPVTVINGTTIKGYGPSRFESALTSH